MDQSLPARERLKDPAAFRRAFDRKRSVSDSLMIVYGVENGLDHSRLGLSIAKRKVRKANARNRIKRVLREAYRLCKAQLPPGVDLIIVARGPAIPFDHARTALPKLARDVARRLGPPHKPTEEPQPR